MNALLVEKGRSIYIFLILNILVIFQFLKSNRTTVFLIDFIFSISQNPFDLNVAVCLFLVYDYCYCYIENNCISVYYVLIQVMADLCRMNALHWTVM